MDGGSAETAERVNETATDITEGDVQEHEGAAG